MPRDSAGTYVPVLMFSDMTLRDWFATQALVAIDQNRIFEQADATNIMPTKIMAVTAYAIADAMLEARK